jgi:carboxypeptidase family protein
MTRRRWVKSLAILALLPLFGLIFWMSAIVASSIPNVLVMAVNVHGLNVTSFAGDSTQRHAPLSLQVLADAQQDTTRAVGPSPTPVATSTPSATGRPTGSRPTPTPSPSPTPLPLPVPTPTNTIPTPTAMPAPATISGQVTDSQTRLAIVGAKVSLSPGGASALTDASGNFSFGVSSGTYTVTASATTYNSASQSVTVGSGQKALVAFKLVSITAYGSLTGAVTDSATKAPIVGATVTLSNGMIRVTDVNGSFSYAIVLNGTYTLTVSALGYLTQSQTVSIKPGHTANVQVALVHA